MTEAHKSLFTIHPGEVCTEFFVNWWNDMKKDVAYYVSKYLVCQQVKVEHQRPGGRRAEYPVTRMEVGALYDGCCISHELRKDILLLPHLCWFAPIGTFGSCDFAFRR